MGRHPLQLHSLGTPNGVKITSLLEELCSNYGIEYDAYLIDIMKGDQFTSGFVDANPNSKIPVLLHYEDGFDKAPRRIFETSAIMIYLCEKFDKDRMFFPAVDHPAYSECLSWIIWVHGSAPYLGGGFGHFFNYAPVKIKYAIDRYTMETKRQLSVLERHLSGADGSRFGGGPYLCGNQITIADFACYPWYGWLVLGKLYGQSNVFLAVDEYPALIAWAEMMSKRESVVKGRMVNRSWGEKNEQLPERHSVRDFEAVEKLN